MMVEKQYNKQVKIVESDNGAEFPYMKICFLKHGIVFQTFSIKTPQKNERVERKHRYILNVACALKF